MAITQNTGGPLAGMNGDSGYPTMVITPLVTVWNADKRAWSQTLQVLYNGTWTAALPADTDWISIEKAGEDKLYIYLTENDKKATRTAVITFTASDGSTATFTVNQAATNPVKWGVSVTEVNLPAAGGTAEIVLTSAESKRWTARMLSDWASLQAVVDEDSSGNAEWDYKNSGMGPATFRVAAEKNTTGMDRRVKLIFKQNIFHDKIVWVNQAGVDEDESASA